MIHEGYKLLLLQEICDDFGSFLYIKGGEIYLDHRDGEYEVTHETLQLLNEHPPLAIPQLLVDHIEEDHTCMSCARLMIPCEVVDHIDGRTCLDCSDGFNRAAELYYEENL